MGISKRVVFVAVLVLLPLAAYGGWREWRTHVLNENHRFAYSARSRLITAQGDYIAAHPAGGGGRNLCQDVSGLYQDGLIDRALAEADDRPIRPLVPQPVPVNGYFARFLPVDEVINGKVTRTKSFAYCLHPAEPGVTGKYIFLRSEEGEFRRCNVGDRPVPDIWPSDEELRKYWAIDCGG